MSETIVPPSSWRARLGRFLDRPAVANTVIALIVVNAIVLGMETVPGLPATTLRALQTLDHALLAVFVVELGLKLLAHGRRFFREPWNLFDFAVIAIALVPASEGFGVLRALRILRALRLISMVPSMRKVVTALLTALPGMGSIVALLGLVMYVAAVMATKLFHDAAPEFFGSLGATARWRSTGRPARPERCARAPRSDPLVLQHAVEFVERVTPQAFVVAGQRGDGLPQRQRLRGDLPLVRAPASEFDDRPAGVVDRTREHAPVDSGVGHERWNAGHFTQNTGASGSAPCRTRRAGAKADGSAVRVVERDDGRVHLAVDVVDQRLVAVGAVQKLLERGLEHGVQLGLRDAAGEQLGQRLAQGPDLGIDDAGFWNGRHSGLLGRVEGFPSPSSCGRVTGERQAGTKSTNLVAKMSTRRMGYVIPPTNPAIMKIL